MILATISAALAAPSFSSGNSASICFRSAPFSFFIILVARHLGKVRAAEERAAFAVAEDHRAAAFFAGDGRLNLNFGRLGIAFFIEIDDRRAARFAFFVFDGIAGATEEFAEAAFAFDHLAAADGAFVLADFADRGFALLVDGLGCRRIRGSRSN